MSFVEWLAGVVLYILLGILIGVALNSNSCNVQERIQKFHFSDEKISHLICKVNPIWQKNN